MTQGSHAAGQTVDAIVIGGGSAASAFARQASVNGAKVLLVERRQLGGTCINRGCVPKKLMWQAAGTAKDMDDLSACNISAKPGLDFANLCKRRDEKLASLRDSFTATLQDAGVRVIQGEARIIEAGTVHVGNATWQARAIVIATGAQPAHLDIPGNECLSTSDAVFQWQSVPDHLLIVGGGYIGCEFAAIFAALGSTVTLITRSKRILQRFDEDAVATVTNNLLNDQVRVKHETTLERAERQDDSRLHAVLSDGTSGHYDQILSAVGRTPTLDAVTAIDAMLNRGKNGALAVDEYFSTSVDGIYAIGDVADRLPLTAVATRDGHALANMLYGGGAEQVALNHVATAAFTLPPIAQVGATPAALNDTGTRYRIDANNVDPLERGTLRPSRGCESAYFHKLTIDATHGHLLGAVLVGLSAPENIAWIAAAIAGQLSSKAIRSAVAIHPSYAEEIVRRDI